MFIAKINVILKESVLDPQGQTILRTTKDIGFHQTKDIRVGKYMEVKLDVSTEDEAKKITDELCNKILVNQVIETFRVQIEKV